MADIFDVEAALKEHPESEVASHLAELHGIDRDAYLKEGHTDADFLKEYGQKTLPSVETKQTTEPVEQPQASLGESLAGGVQGAAVAHGLGIPKALKAAKTYFTKEPSVDTRPWTPSASDIPGEERWYNMANKIEEKAKIVRRNTELAKRYPNFVRMTPEGELVPTTLGGKVAANLSNLAQTKTGKGFTTGANLVDVVKHAGTDTLGNVQAGVAGLGAAAPFAQKFLPKKLQPIATGLQLGAPVVNYFIDKFGRPQPVNNTVTPEKTEKEKFEDLEVKHHQVNMPIDFLQYTFGISPFSQLMYADEAAKMRKTFTSRFGEQKAQGGVVGYDIGGKVAKAGLDIAKKLFTPTETKVVKASEALGPHEGKWLLATQSDRMRSTGGDLGGPGFSKFQLENPDYAGAAWGVGKKSTASGIINVNKLFPEGQAIWTPMIGSETQHHSNQHVYDALVDEFNRQARLGNLPKELQAKINARLTAPNKEGATLFPPEFDIGNPEHLKEFGDTFDKRGAISTVLSGKGVGGTKGRIIDYPGIMQEMTDPMTIGAPTHSLGTRLFTLSNEIEHRPDLHSAFPYILKGEDQGVAFAPIPKELGLQKYIETFKDFKGREPGYYDLTRTIPREQITDKLLRSWEAAGHAEGGLVNHYDIGGKVTKEVLKYAHGQIPEVAQALENYLKGNISQKERIELLNKYLPIRQWSELPPNYTDEQIRNALMANKQAKALVDVPAGMRVGNRLDIPAYTQHGVYVDTTHDVSGKPISYNRTGHLTDVEFSSKPNQAVRVGLGTKEQALTPLGAEIGSAKSPFALIKGTNVGTKDDEVRRMMQEYINDPNWTQIGMDPRRHSQFYDKSTGLPVWSAEEKLQSGPLILAPKRGLETTDWTDPRLNLSDFAGKQYADGGSVAPDYNQTFGADIGYPTGLPAQQAQTQQVQQPTKDPLQGYLDWMIPFEGKLHNTKGDPGGLTNYGLTKMGMSGYLGRPATAEDIKAVTPESAREIYTKGFYQKLGLDQYDPKTAILAMDAAVNQGPTFAKNILKQTGGDYQKLLAARQAQYAKSNPKFKKGWDNRMNQLLSYIDTLPEAGDD